MAKSVTGAALSTPQSIARVTLTITRGVAAGWLGGIPQVLVAQAEERLLGLPRESADIGPRFIRRAAQHAGTRLSRPMQWLVAGVFHFEYAAWWGALYAAATELIGWRRVPPLLGAAVLGSVIYAAAFSPLGGATRTGAERPVGQRRWRETLLHWSAAMSFALTAAYAYDWLRERW